MASHSHLNQPAGGGLNESLNYCKSEARLQEDTSSDYKFAEGGINSG